MSEKFFSRTNNPKQTNKQTNITVDSLPFFLQESTALLIGVKRKQSDKKNTTIAIFIKPIAILAEVELRLVASL